ncbi:MAG: carbohydrate binding domain-containing protein [Candidatus Hodarchaeota archaeon]
MLSLYIKKIIRGIYNKLIQRREVIFIILSSLFFLYIYRKLPFSKMFAFGDLPPFTKNFSLLWRRFVFIWQYEYLGFPLPDRSFQIFVGIIILIFGNPIIVQKILLLSTIPIAFISMYIYTAYFVESDLSRFMTSIIYCLNPISIGRFVNGGPLDFLFLYSVLPLLWLKLINIINGKRIYDVLLFAIITGLIGSLVYNLFWAIIPFTAVLILVKFFQMRGKNKSFLLGVILVFFSISLGLLLVLPDIISLFQRNEILVSQFETLIGAVDWCYSTSTPLNLLRLAGNGGDLMMRRLGYNDMNLWTVNGLIIPLVAFYSLFFINKEKGEFILLFLTIIITTILFILLTHFKITYPLFQAVPILFSLKNPVKLMYPMSLALCSLFAIGLDGIINKIKLKNLISKIQVLIFNTLLFIMIFLYLFPVLGGGTIGLNEVYGDSYYIPTEYETVLNWIKEQRETGEFFRTLWLPYNYTTQIRLSTNDPYNIGLRSGAAWLNIPNINFVRDIFETICKRNTANFGEILKMLNVKYIIITSESEQTRCLVMEKQVTPWILGNNLYFTKFVEDQYDLEEIFRYKNITVYENKKFVPSHISIYDSLIFLVPKLNDPISNFTTLTSNLLQNPDFEMDIKSWWIDEKYKRAYIDEVTCHKGICSIRITNYDQKNWSSIAQSVSVEGDGTYYVSAWVRTENVNDAHIKMVWFDENEAIVQTDFIVKIGEIEGTNNWFQISKVIKAPQNAATTSIRLIGGLSSDGETAAITWFDNIEFYEISPTISDSFIPNYLSLSNVYGFNSSKHLTVFEKDISYNEILELLNISKIIVFSHPIKSQLIRYMSHIDNQTILQIFEAETLPATERSLILNNSMSNGKAIKINNGTASLEFYAPRSSYYKIGINGLYQKISIFIDNINISIKNQHETDTKYLDIGYHTLNIVSEDAIFDQIQIISATSKKEIDNVFTSKSDLKSRIESMKSMRDYYLIDFEFEDPTFMVLRESYHKDWKLSTQNSVKNENFIHFKALNWANAFYIPKTDRITVKIEFKQQAMRDLLIKIWILSWSVIFSFFIYKSIRGKYFNAIYVKLCVAQKMINKFD